jgi:hypothetical protein
MAVDIAPLLAELDLEEKVSLLAGQDFWSFGEAPFRAGRDRRPRGR